ncbi:MAG: alpha/beta fold hydrolase [Acutalibacteraceae bacterium]|nr:alpha/beta fold hydrolase [Acutalibacteraceae bacterium]
MTYEIKSIEVQSTDNIHTLKGLIYIPDGEIRGIFHLVHGMCEYIGRYAHVFSALAKDGYVCCGYDNLGHGETARDENELGFIAHRDGWKYLVKDVKAFEDAVRKIYPDIPLYLMGHSMGSFIARIAAENYGDEIEKFIICGTGGPNHAAPFGLIATDIMRFLFGEKHRSNFVNSLAFGAYNKRFDGDSEFEWITTDREIITKYESDKYCNFKFTVSAMHDLIKLNALCNRKAWYNNIRKSLPVLLISGSDDPVGAYGKGVTKVYEKLKTAGVNDVTLRLYSGCRHEIHNDSCKETVISDILKFIWK